MILLFSVDWALKATSAVYDG